MLSRFVEHKCTSAEQGAQTCREHQIVAAFLERELSREDQPRQRNEMLVMRNQKSPERDRTVESPGDPIPVVAVWNAKSREECGGDERSGETRAERDTDPRQTAQVPLSCLQNRCRYFARCG